MAGIANTQGENVLNTLPNSEAVDKDGPEKSLNKDSLELDKTTDAPSNLPDHVTKNLVQLFKLLSDETRLRILYFLMQKHELNVRSLCDILGQSQPAVSHHLALLRVAGLIESRRDGKHNFYHILPQRFQELLAMIFRFAPEESGSIRFEDYQLRYSQVGVDE